MVIEGGLSGRKAEVNEENELVVRAITESEIEHASAKLGTAFSWVSTNTDIDIGDTRLFIKNDSNTPLVVDRATFNPANVACSWSINLGKTTTTPVGTVVSAVNLSQAGLIAEAVSIDDETAVVDGDTIEYIETETVGTIDLNLTGVILRKGHYIQINQETETTSGRVIVWGHFENPS